MKHRTLYAAAVPSSTLLKFLRAQEKGVPFFNSNTLRSISCDANGQSCASTSHTFNQPWTRPVTTIALPLRHLESTFFSLEALWPKRSPKSDVDRVTYVPDKSGAHPCADQLRGPSRALTTSNKREDGYGSRSFWHFGRKHDRQPPQTDALPGLSSFLDENSAIGKPLRGANELKLRCTELNEHGNVTLVNGEFKKGELIARYGLLPRDLRKIDSSLLPSIMIRQSAILINLLHLRVLIKHDRVLVLDAYGTSDTHNQSMFMYDLEGKLKTPETRTPGSSTVGGALPYEFRALEAVLLSVTNGLESEFEGVREPVARVLRELEEDVDRDKLRHLLIYSKKLSSFEQKARLVRNAIDDLLEADDDLSGMYLSEKAKGVEREEDDHAEIEMLLESYHKVCDEIVQVSGNLVSNIRTTEEIVKAILDANRNSLMLLDLKFTIGTLGLGAGTFFAALYGMNLKNFWEENDIAFVGVSVFSAVCGMIVGRWGFRKLKQVQKVSMWGQTRGDNTMGRRNWNSITDRPLEPVAGFGRRERPRSRETQMAGGEVGHPSKKR